MTSPFLHHSPGEKLQRDGVEASGAESGKLSFEAMTAAHETPAQRSVDRWIKPSSVCLPHPAGV